MSIDPYLLKPTTPMSAKLARMRELIGTLGKANHAYYNTGAEIISNYEYDALYDELKVLEDYTGIVLSASPTQKVGYEPVSKLPKETHKIPALSLDKTKDVDQLGCFLGNRDGVLSWKLDGLTVVLTYNNGLLEKAVTRGNGTVGEVVTDNAKCFLNVPCRIPDKSELIVRGEALIAYDDFERINEQIPETEERYKNPRNLCAGSVRQLDPNEVKNRNVRFIAFALVESGAFTSRMAQLDYLKSLGFDVVAHVKVSSPESVKAQVANFASLIPENRFPSDGLVLQYDNIAYGESLGTTSKYPRDSMAFKWEDETRETVVRGIEWSASRTGLINPVAVFDPVELEGTTVTRASVHNVSIMKKLSLSKGDIVSVYKANMIIPQIAENLTRHGEAVIPDTCPVCSQPAVIRTMAGDAQTLWCLNPDCPAKHVKAFVHAASRDALNIEGLSEETIKKLINIGMLSTLPDLFHIKDHGDVIMWMEGFGKKSFQNLVNSIETARNTNLQKLIYALGINNVGRTASKAICRHFAYDTDRVVNATMDDLLAIPDIGNIIAASFTEWFGSQLNQELFENLLEEVSLERPALSQNRSLAGNTYVVTGSLNHFKNRDELKAKIESLGGKVSGSVSSKTTFLINNDSGSTSGKNKKAKDLGIPIITEEEFLEMIG